MYFVILFLYHRIQTNHLSSLIASLSQHYLNIGWIQYRRCILEWEKLNQESAAWPIRKNSSYYSWVVMRWLLFPFCGYFINSRIFLCPRMMCFLSFSLRLQYTAAWVHLSSNTLTVILNGLTPMTAMFVSYNCLYFSRSVKLKRWDV